MKYTSKTNHIFTRYDVNIEVTHKKSRKISEDIILQKITDCLITGDEEEIEDIIKEALKTRHPLDIINKKTYFCD